MTKMSMFGIFFSQYCMSIGLLSVLLYMYGFFPIKSSSNIFSSRLDFPSNLQNLKFHQAKLYESSVGQTVLMVIDGLRVDFVTVENMPFTAGLIAAGEGSEACQLTARVSAPTVTLPRIKAIVTGTVSSFIDVVLNIGAPELTLDSIIFQASQTKKVIFYGDDTWIKLFPHQFIRSEGTSSFFVNDYTEVDTNVTRHLDTELLKDDWDLMVLHYLGLDHIGHIEGPKSPLAPPKLREMDNIIARLHTYLQSKPGGTLVVCGDHGMKDTGSHGGVSLPEVLVPFIVLGLSCPGHFKEEVLQVDIAATLSVLWGAPIPADNIGVAVAGLLAHLTTSQRLYAWLYNAQQLASNFLRNRGNPQHDSYLMYKEAMKLHFQWLANSTSNTVSHQEVEALYKASLIGMSRFLSDVLANYDMFALISAIAVVFQAVCMLGVVVAGAAHPLKARVGRALLVSCELGGPAAMACVITPVPGWPVYLTIPTVLVLTFNSVYLYYTLRTSSSVFKEILLSCGRLSKETFLLLGMLLFCISMFSSSLIEEEHQLWYFLWVTICTSYLIESPAPWVCVLAAHRYLRSLNQTGDKWAHLPDTSDWLTLPHNRLLLSVLCFLSLLCVGWCSTTVIRHHISWLLCLCIATCIYLYKTAVLQVVTLLPGISVYLSSNGVLEARLCWCLLGLLVLLGRSLGSLVACCLLASCLLLRPYNTVLPLSMFIITRVLNSPKKPFGVVYTTVLHHWLGTVFFFYQGNSNSLASVDLGAGYVGLEQYNTFLVGLLLMYHTYSMPVQAFLLNIHSLGNTSKNHKADITCSVQVVALLQLLHVLVCLIVITIQRYHLFVWTVFSPKLLYVAAQTSVYFILVSITNVFLYFKLP